MPSTTRGPIKIRLTKLLENAKEPISDEEHRRVPTTRQDRLGGNSIHRNQQKEYIWSSNVPQAL